MASGGQSYVSRLPLTPLTHDDEGDYTCTAEYIENGTYSASDTYHVTISGKYFDGKLKVCILSYTQHNPDHQPRCL